jgi:hypothetical protein
LGGARRAGLGPDDVRMVASRSRELGTPAAGGTADPGPGSARPGNVQVQRDGALAVAVPPRGAPHANATADAAGGGNAGASAEPPVDNDVSAILEARRARIAVLKVEGPRMLNAGNWRRAGELCRAWADLEITSAEALRCLGQALQAQGYYQDAINAYRKAKQYDPGDRSLDVAIDRAQRGIVADFLNRYRR